MRYAEKLGSRSYQQRAQLGSQITDNGNIVTWVQENGVHEVSVYNWQQTDYRYIGNDYTAAAAAFNAARTNA